jgi:hypothetical protein
MSGVLWIIGWMFTCGLVIDPAEKSAKWIIPVSVGVWPLLLGCFVNSLLSNAESEVSE